MPDNIGNLLSNLGGGLLKSATGRNVPTADVKPARRSLNEIKAFIDSGGWVSNYLNSDSGVLEKEKFERELLGQGWSDEDVQLAKDYFAEQVAEAAQVQSGDEWDQAKIKLAKEVLWGKTALSAIDGS